MFYRFEQIFFALLQSLFLHFRDCLCVSHPFVFWVSSFSLSLLPSPPLSLAAEKRRERKKRKKKKKKKDSKTQKTEKEFERLTITASTSGTSSSSSSSRSVSACSWASPSTKPLFVDPSPSLGVSRGGTQPADSAFPSAGSQAARNAPGGPPGAPRRTGRRRRGPGDDRRHRTVAETPAPKTF